MIDLKLLERRFKILFKKETHTSFNKWVSNQKPLDEMEAKVLNKTFARLGSKTPTRL